MDWTLTSVVAPVSAFVCLLMAVVSVCLGTRIRATYREADAMLERAWTLYERAGEEYTRALEMKAEYERRYGSKV